MAKYVREPQIIYFEKSSGLEFYHVTVLKIGLFRRTRFATELWMANKPGAYDHTIPLEEQAYLIRDKVVVEIDDTKWYVNSKGLLHRPDGPAMDSSPKCSHWYLDGKWMDFTAYWKRQRHTKYAAKIMAYKLGSTAG